MSETESTKGLWRRARDYLLRRFNVRKYGSFAFIGLYLTVYGGVFIQVCVWLAIDANLANFAQAIISVVANFVMNRKTTWKDRRDIPVWAQVILYTIGKFISIPLNALVFAWVLGWSTPLIAYGISTVLITAYNYLLGEKFVYGSWVIPVKESVKGVIQKVRK